MKYQTRMSEHLNAVNMALQEKKLPPLTWKDVARGSEVPYSTLRRYVLDKQDAPNFAIADQVRRFLNSVLPRREQFSDAGYIYPAEESEGQPVGVVTITA